MIFAHGPAGFLLGWVTDSVKKPLKSPKQRWWLLFVGFFAGIWPDTDLFYYYLVDASGSHRQYITHTPFFYITLCALVVAGLWALKKKECIIWPLVFTLGAISHTVTDTMLAQVMLLYPFSTEFYGLADLAIPFLENRLFFLNFLVEGVFCFFFFYVLIWELTKTRVQRLVWTGILGLVFVAGVTTLTYIDLHTYHTNFNFYYDDLDGDGIPNFEDRDIDGDGQLNIDDLDSDGDGESNPLEITKHAEGFIGVLYDPTDGGAIQIPARLGLITNQDIARRLYFILGINFKYEFAADYAENPDGYELSPGSSQFDRSLQNLRTWIDHRGLLETGAALADGRNQLGDILFYESGYVAVVTAFDNKGQAKALDIQKDRPAIERFVTDIEQDEGPVLARGKLLSSKGLYAEEDDGEGAETKLSPPVTNEAEK